MQRLFPVLSFLFFVNLLSAQSKINWDILADVSFRTEFIEQFGMDYDMPTFGKEVKEYEGEEVLLSGYMLPLDGTGMQLVLSKFPFTACYFCGGAGPETVIELWMKPDAIKRYKTDERLTFKGKLRLNTTDYFHLSYILLEAEEWED